MRRRTSRKVRDRTLRKSRVRISKSRRIRKKGTRTRRTRTKVHRGKRTRNVRKRIIRGVKKPKDTKKRSNKRGGSPWKWPATRSSTAEPKQAIPIGQGDKDSVVFNIYPRREVAPDSSADADEEDPNREKRITLHRDDFADTKVGDVELIGLPFYEAQGENSVVLITSEFSEFMPFLDKNKLLSDYFKLGNIYNIYYSYESQEDIDRLLS